MLGITHIIKILLKKTKKYLEYYFEIPTNLAYSLYIPLFRFPTVYSPKPLTNNSPPQ